VILSSCVLSDGLGDYETQRKVAQFIQESFPSLVIKLWVNPINEQGPFTQGGHPTNEDRNKYLFSVT
jgi:hypothetical protein